MASATAPTSKPTTSPTVPGLSDDNRPSPSVLSARAGADGSLAEDIADTLGATVRAARAVLPNRLPVALAVAALLVVGAVEPPVALAGGLAYEALRRWSPSGRARQS